MSLDQVNAGAPALEEARRQLEICNACRYCEGYCAVFPAMTRQKAFADGDLTQLANLCHNCRGCYYACQYTEPHEFALNLPAALADVRVESWERYAWPTGLAPMFQRNGLAIAMAVIAGFALLFAAVAALPGGGEGFYAYLSHGAMVAIFLPAFVFPMVAIGIALRRYWADVGGKALRASDVTGALHDAGRMKNLDGGQGQGCNFEDGDRFSNARRIAHQLILYGFLLCFASTSVATLMHYLMGWEAPYGFWTPPKMLGVPGGILLVAGVLWMASLKVKADHDLGAKNVAGGEIWFYIVLLVVAASGLLLYALGGTGAVAVMLPLHLGSVLTFFLLMPYSKMVHGFFRLAALMRDRQDKG
ncbi:4Fe-4S ferredoxin [Oceanicola sp. 22II-s10i]|uniref:tricarballylate utilization 4Fe-4S protein TcuB n=1 Tax=Oceanicola sp. 22II-s10i TaxID=1317116 RepID=UPI000B51FF08|nr:tricarballylate utilization 4Fe-4S protein TcuB [Oceanicola sp. 22II-s10i]OWU83440.1 4Fe-4S ferredoxin [Oceanicola sp. 22II-s10i]